MTITLELPKAAETEIKKRAERSGQDVESYVLKLVERDISPSWNEIVAPIYDRTRELGLSEEDIEKLVDKELAAVRRETPLWAR